MISVRSYVPEVRNQNQAIIGLPGFLHKDETSRIDHFLEELSKSNGIYGVRVNFPGIERVDKAITCNFNVGNYVKTLAETVNHVRESHTGNIAVIASSVSAGVLGHYIGENGNPFDMCVNISPLPGWQEFANPKVREAILKAGNGIPLTSERDKRFGITRDIPQEYVEEALKFNSLMALEKYDPTKRPMKVLTLAGTKDQVVGMPAMRKFHAALGGIEEGLWTYDFGHDIPHDITREKVIEFLTA